LAEDEDAGWVSAEGGDVVADPLEGEDEIELTDVAGVAEEITEGGRGEFGEIEVAEEVETVVEGDDDGVAAAGETEAVVDGAVGGAGGVGTAVYVDEDGTLAIVVDAGCPDVEVEAIFRVDGTRLVERSEGGAAFAVVNGLWSLRAVGEGVTDACPGGWRCGRAEASDGGIGAVGDPFEGFDALIGDAANLAEGRSDDGIADRPGAEVLWQEICGAEDGGVAKELATVHLAAMEDGAERG
jgi:hypothetical protein